ncbi:MAG: hypothetical protein HY738_19225 [Bacteroidia bacterium]|nr:hypothetical protein [Bacteroidia bacterium]
MPKTITMSYWYYNYNYRKARRPKKTSTTPVQRKKFGQTFWGQQWLNSLIINTGEKWLGDLSNRELKDIVALSKKQ